MAAKVSIVILNWNGLTDTAECLESLKKVTYPSYDVIVVDNASQGEDVKLLREKFGDYIHIIRNDSNYGFAKGNNIGIRYALQNGAAYVLLLNNDTTVDPRFLTEMVSVAEADREIGMVCPKIYFYDRPDLVNFDGGVKVSLWWGALKWGPRQGDECPVIKTEFATGTAMIIPATTLEQIGLLPEEYFFGIEDIDYSVRALRNNFKIVVARRAVVLHKASRTAAPSMGETGIIYQFSKGWQMLRRKYMSRPAYLLSSPVVLARQIFTASGNLLRSIWRRDWQRVTMLLRIFPSGMKGMIKGLFSS